MTVVNPSRVTVCERFPAKETEILLTYEHFFNFSSCQTILVLEAFVPFTGAVLRVPNRVGSLFPSPFYVVGVSTSIAPGIEPVFVLRISALLELIDGFYFHTSSAPFRSNFCRRLFHVNFWWKSDPQLFPHAPGAGSVCVALVAMARKPVPISRFFREQVGLFSALSTLCISSSIRASVITSGRWTEHGTGAGNRLRVAAHVGCP